jgi:hypothetical protein
MKKGKDQSPRIVSRIEEGTCSSVATGTFNVLQIAPQRVIIGALFLSRRLVSGYIDSDYLTEGAVPGCGTLQPR